MVKLLIISIIETLGVENVWDNILGKKVSQTFGQECASAAIWMFFILLLRSVIFLVGLAPHVPNGLIFSFPYFIQMVSTLIPFVRDSIPLLPVRVVECLLGRVSSSQFLVVFPAHFLGSIVGIVFFQCLCPVFMNEVLIPVHFPRGGGGGFSAFSLLAEILLTACFCLTFVIVKEMLVLNKFKEAWLSVFVLPFYFVMSVDQCPSFHPAAMYALWYVHFVSSRGGAGTSGLAPDLDLTSSLSQIQIEHLLGPVLGAVLAGLLCVRFFPDDPSSWRPRR